MKNIIISILILSFCIPGSFAQTEQHTTKPWTYWWWMGSAVDENNIDKELQWFSEVGIGGVHIVPIYGVKGYEDNFLLFLSEKWMKEVQYTIKRAGELNLGVDITLGTGWPYGGSWIDKSISAKRFKIEEYVVEKQNSYSIKELNNKFELDSLYAIFVRDGNETINLLKSGNEGVHSLKNYIGDTVQIIGIQSTMQWVKRAAPGGEGLVVDYFNKKAVQAYLNHFDSVFSNTQYPISPRAFYHDSYEVYGASCTPNIFEEFIRLNGYDLMDYLDVLADTSHNLYPYLQHDLGLVIDELLYSDFTSTWTQFCKNNAFLTRNQAHGSPANILDLYALSDIPETESFGCSIFDIPGLNCDPDYEEERFGRPNPLMMKFASSPAHLLGKPLVSSETATWLANHFKVSLRRVKPQIDELFISGINHVFYHGCTYSPAEEDFPGWLFYASTNFGKTSHFKDEFPLLNKYIENSQRLLQNSNPDNNILLYFPLDDIWTKNKGRMLLALDVHHYSKWFGNTGFGKTANLLWANGYTFDYISDRQISGLNIDKDKNIFSAETSKYQTIVVPEIDFISKQTMEELGKLAEKGARIIFVKNYPTSYSGLKAHLANEEVSINKNIMLSDNLLNELKQINVPQEELSMNGLRFIRKKNKQGNLYFITNFGSKTFEDSVSLASEYNYISVFDPLTGSNTYVETKDYISLKVLPGSSYFLQTSPTRPDLMQQTTYQPYDTLFFNGKWKVNFKHTHEVSLTDEFIIDTLTSWTTWGNEALNAFTGKAIYVYEFSMNEKKEKTTQKYVLQFDQIHESAEVVINGKSYGTIWSFPNQIELPAKIFKKKNRIEIKVQNLSANYMRVFDKENPGWKKFYNINIADITYTPFDASKWELEPSGLVGSVKLIKYK